MFHTQYLQRVSARPASITQLLQEATEGGGTGWIWILLIVVLVVLIAWWGYRSSRQAAATQSEPTRSTEPETAADKSDDLVIIEGIGPKIAEVLKLAGITTFAQLAQTSPAQLEEILKAANLRLADPSTWPEQARLAAAGDLESLKAFQDRLKGGRATAT